MRILIVEDEAYTRTSLEECIRDTQYGFDEILTADNGRNGFKIFMEKKPEIVLTDIRMIGGDGIELAQRIYEVDRNTAIVFLTAYSQLEYMKQAIHVNAVDYVTKPVSMIELDCAILRSMEKVNSYARQNIGLLRERFLKGLFGRENDDSVADYRRHIRELGFPVDGFCLTVISVCGTELKKYLPDSSMEYPALEKTVLGKTVAQILEELPFSFRFIYNTECILIICAVRSGDPLEADRIFRKLAQRLSDSFYENCFEGVEVRMSRAEKDLRYLKNFELTSAEIFGTLKRNPVQESNISSREKHMVECIHEIIAADYADSSLKVSDIADKLCYTSAYLCMIYKKVTGITINDSINLYRIEKSKQFMEAGNVRIHEAAVRAGYSNENYFSKVFRKYEGISPKEYRYGKEKGRKDKGKGTEAGS